MQHLVDPLDNQGDQANNDAAEADYEMLEGTDLELRHGHVVHPIPDGFTSVSHLRAFSYTPFISLCSTSLTTLTPTAMKSLLRRKTPTDNVKKPSPQSSTQYTRQPPTTETPLYARFASTKPTAQSLEKTPLVVSGPMPLGRPSRGNLEADSRRKHEDENPSRGRLSSGRRVPTGPESQLDAHGFQPSLHRSSQDVPVDLGPSIKARTACKSHFSVPIARRRSPLLRYAILDDVHSLRTSEHLRMAAVSLCMVTGSLFAAFPCFCGSISHARTDF
jgi:hypothetical protein